MRSITISDSMMIEAPVIEDQLAAEIAMAYGYYIDYFGKTPFAEVFEYVEIGVSYEDLAAEVIDDHMFGRIRCSSDTYVEDLLFEEFYERLSNRRSALSENNAYEKALLLNNLYFMEKTVETEQGPIAVMRNCPQGFLYNIQRSSFGDNISMMSVDNNFIDEIEAIIENVQEGDDTDAIIVYQMFSGYSEGRMG